MSGRILVIDDDLDSLKLISLLLQRQGYEVVAAPGGDEGLQKARADMPDLILLDIMMPNMDGYEVCRQLRGDPHLAHVPVIMFTAKTRVDDKVAGFEAGADDYLTKPTHPAELASRIRSLLSRTRAAELVDAEQELGKVVAILGIKGGTGATTLAVNLGAVLNESSRDVILADLHAGMGTVGLHLGYPQEDGVSRLLRLPLAELDQESVGAIITSHPSGLRLVLTGYYRSDVTGPLSASHLERIITLLPLMADLVLLDLGNRVSSHSRQALVQANLVILCLSPQRTSMTMARALLNHLAHIGVDSDRLGIAVIQTSPSLPAISAAQVEAELQVPVLGSIEPAPQLALVAMEQARPIVWLEPHSTTAGQFRELAEGVVDRLEQAHRRAG
jgi:DNA-binding response OmpR family regulator